MNDYISSGYYPVIELLKWGLIIIAALAALLLAGWLVYKFICRGAGFLRKTDDDLPDVAEAKANLATIASMVNGVSEIDEKEALARLRLGEQQSRLLFSRAEKMALRAEEQRYRSFVLGELVNALLEGDRSLMMYYSGKILWDKVLADGLSSTVSPDSRFYWDRILGMAQSSRGACDGWCRTYERQSAELLTQVIRLRGDIQLLVSAVQYLRSSRQLAAMVDNLAGAEKLLGITPEVKENLLMAIQAGNDRVLSFDETH